MDLSASFEQFLYSTEDINFWPVLTKLLWILDLKADTLGTELTCSLTGGVSLQEVESSKASFGLGCVSHALNPVGTFQLKTLGNVTVELSKAANKLRKSTKKQKTGQLRCQIQCGATPREFFFYWGLLSCDWLRNQQRIYCVAFFFLYAPKKHKHSIRNAIRQKQWSYDRTEKLSCFILPPVVVNKKLIVVVRTAVIVLRMKT